MSEDDRGDVHADRALGVRERILNAAIAAFLEHGVARATTLDIATRAKASKRELYALFGNKQQLLVACIGARTHRPRRWDDGPVPRTPQDLGAVLSKFALVLLKEVTDPEVIALYRLAIGESDRAPEVAQALDAYGRQAYSVALCAILERARLAGLLPQAPAQRMADRFMALLLHGVLLDLALGLVARPGSAEIWRRAQEATQEFLALYPTPQH